MSTVFWVHLCLFFIKYVMSAENPGLAAVGCSQENEQALAPACQALDTLAPGCQALVNASQALSTCLFSASQVTGSKLAMQEAKFR